MSLTIRQYAFIFLLMIMILVGLFGIYSYGKLTETRTNIHESIQTSARKEFDSNFSAAKDLLKSSAENFIQWQEIQQQFEHPSHFSYWFNNRLKQATHPLQQIGIDIMLYHSDGHSIAELAQSKLPKKLERLYPETQVYINSENYQTYTIPVRDEAKGIIIGYLAFHFDLVKLYGNSGKFQFIKSDSISIDPKFHHQWLDQITDDLLNYQVTPTPEIELLEAQLVDTMLGIMTTVLLPTILLYFLLVYVFSVPIQRISEMIIQLSNSPSQNRDCQQKSVFRVAELNEICESLIHYHSDLFDTHAILDKKNKALWEQAHHDALTAVYNRRAFDEQWHNLNDLLAEHRVNVSFMLFDINLFKSINDTYGHAVGDEVLKVIATCISESLRKGEHLFRLGGDEFATFLIDASTEIATDVATRCLNRISEFDFAAIGMPEPVRVSIGISQAKGGDTDAFNDLQWQADAAMYAAKRPGTNDIVVYTDEITDNSKGLLSSWLSNTVYQAIDKGIGLVLFYQPIIKLDDETISYYEALIRIYANDELISPASIFNVVEARHFEVELDRAVIRKLTESFEQNKIPPGSGVSLNMSAQSLTRPEVSEWLKPLQQFTDKFKIVIEVTETALITEVKRVTEHLRVMRDMNFVIALDDFGSGYSSVKYLATMPVDIVKFDITIIHSLLDEEQRHMITRLAEMIKEAGHTLVAEGIEDTELLGLVIDTGFDYGQGFLFGRAEEIPVNKLDFRS